MCVGGGGVGVCVCGGGGGGGTLIFSSYIGSGPASKYQKFQAPPKIFEI